VDDPKRPHERKRDYDLKETLRDEAPGFLAWLARGFLAWQERRLSPPECVKAATAEYQKSEDTFSLFLEEEGVANADKTASAKALLERYGDWTKRMHLPPMSGTAFGRRMGALFAREHTRSGYRYRGVGLRVAGPGVMGVTGVTG
jgi:phage/plasmid-associated DNA primase